ncbi:uncharacterized protein LOC133192886 [Saccostrea echinata]|uniref:uncharacterized protein LOC133192886 n=1 Tax=Saccostrea echinata TaxID=191078 RepID=UPI002A81F379|nr:uncharacterized protein LOC133192886 [Saccostrea echinata]
MHLIKTTFVVLLCTFLKAEGLLFHGQTNATSASNGHSDPDVYKQLLHLETVLNSIMMDQKQQAQKFEQKQNLLEGEIQMLKQWNRTAQMKISLLESENKILKERLDKLISSSNPSQDDICLNEKLNNLNSTSTFLLQENIILKDQIKILNSTSMLIQQNLTTSGDQQRLGNNLTFEIEQMVREREQKMMKNMSATIKDLELRDRYLSLSLLDVHNNTAELSSSLLSLDVQQNQMKNEIQAMTNSQQNDIAKLNDTIIRLKNRVQSNVAFTAGILGEETKQHTYTVGDTVKFPQVIYQVGGGYNPTTGVFTAPKAGLYLIFGTSVAGYHETFWTKIMINGSAKPGVMAYLNGSVTVYLSASNLVVHQLQVGDKVWIQVRKGSHLYSYTPDTTFSVVMINGSD